MIRNLFRKKNVRNTRKFYKPNYKLHNTNIQKNKRTVLYDNEPIENFIRIKGKYKFLKDKLKSEEIKVKKKITNEKTIPKSKGYDLNEIKKFADNIKFDKVTNMVLGVGFEWDIQNIRIQTQQVQPDILKFGENFTQLTEQLGSLNDNELIQFLRHSVALKASPFFENQARGILLKESIKEEIDKRFENEAEYNKNLPSLIKKLSMKIVYGKVDEILKQKNLGSSYEHNDIIQMFLEDPYINPNSFFAQNLIMKIYSDSDKTFNFRNEDDPLSQKNLYEQHFQQNYLAARAEILCTLADVNINRSILLTQQSAKQIHSKKEIELREKEDFKQLTMTLKDILADYTMHNNLNNSIKKLESANPIVYHQEAEDEYYENSDQEPDEHTSNAWYSAEQNFNHREFDHTANRDLYELNRSYLNEMEKKLYLARNPDSQKVENLKPVHLDDLPEEFLRDDQHIFRDQQFKKTNQFNYSTFDLNLIKKEFDDRQFRQINYFNFLTKKNYDKLFDSRNLQAIRSILGKDIHGSKLHRYLFYNSQWFVGKKLRVRNNNYQCFDQLDENEYNVDFEIEEEQLGNPESYNDYLEIKYDKFRTTGNNVVLNTDKRLFKTVEIKEIDNALDKQPFYSQLIQYYKESNRSYFYNHYIQTSLKEYQLFSRQQKMDILEQEIDPNYGFYNVKGGISEYSEEFLKSKKDQKQIISKLNPKLQAKEDKLDDLRELYPNLFKIKEPQQKIDQKTVQIYSSQGSRKTARATAVLKIPGTGKVKVNNRQFTEYFFAGDDRNHALKPIGLINKLMEVDIEFFVHGGNLSTQSEASKLALARATCKAYPEFTNHFRNLHFLYRDPRTKERKKINSYGARKSYTYVRR